MMSLAQLKFLPVKMNIGIKENLIAFILFSVLQNQCYAVAVGESYGGGTVFCVSKTSDTTQCVTEGSGDYGLIMANEDQVNRSNPNHGVTWSSKYKRIGDSAQSKDDGATNTDAIISAHPKDDSSNNAAWLCHNYKDKIEGHTDWYLPSRNELNKMYVYAKSNNLIGKDCIGSKVNGVQCFLGGVLDCDLWKDYMLYWSSTEYYGDSTFAWGYNFIDGGLDYYAKYVVDESAYNRFAVRAVRAFSDLSSYQPPYQPINLNFNLFLSKFISCPVQ